MEREKAVLLRVEEAAKILNVKPSTIRAWLLRRKLPCVRVGARAIRIPSTAIQQIIEVGLIPAREQR